MRTMKRGKVITFLLAFIMVLTLIVNPVLADDPAPSFSDVKPGDWFYPYVMCLFERGIVKGYGNTGEFRPNNKVIREHAAKMICLAAGLDHAGKDVDFPDRDQIEPDLIPYIGALVEQGAIGGFGDGNFRPSRNILRGHAAKIVVHAFGLKMGDKPVNFPDLPTDNAEVAQAIRILASNGIVSGYAGTGEFGPDNDITRAELAKILCISSAVAAVQRAESARTLEAIDEAQPFVDELPVLPDDETKEELQERLDALRAALMDTGVVSVAVAGEAALVDDDDDSVYHVTLPAGTGPGGLTKEDFEIILSNPQGASSSDPETSDGGLSWTFTVTAEDGVTQKDYTVHVTAVSTAAEFMATGAVGIAPDSAGPAAGKIFVEYELRFGGVKVSLAAANVDSIKMRKDGGAWQDLTPDTDTTLWFNVDTSKGLYDFLVETRAGATYEASLDWDPEIKEGDWLVTGREGPHEGVFCVEYMLLDGGDDQVSLKADDVKLLAIKEGGKWVALGTGAAKNLWFAKASGTGDYDFFIVTADDVMYQATLAYEMPVPEAAEFTATGGLGIAPDSAGPAAGKIYVEYEMGVGGVKVSLAADNVSSIKTRKAGEEQWRELTPDTDTTLWFNVETAHGLYEFRVVTRDGKIYDASLDWDEEIKKGTWESTSREGEHEGVTYVEYRLLDGDEPISLKIGAVRLIARLKDGKWVALTPNTDKTLWFAKAHETGDYDFFIVTDAGVMYKAILSYVKPAEAAFVSTGDVGIAPESAGPAAGKIYLEYELQFGGVKISLAEGNAVSIKMRKDGGAWQNLTPDTDTTLWFNVETAKGLYEFRVETEDGAVYEAPLDWDPEIAEAAWEFTGREGEHEGVTYVEYRLLDGDDPISLKIGEVKLIARLKDGKWVALTPNTDVNLWFNKAHETGDYDYFIVAGDGAMYQATLSYVKPVEAAFVPTGDVGIAPDSAGPAGGKIYLEYELQFGGVKISLAEGNAVSIKMRKDGGTWRDLTPDTDTTLWFNVETAKGFYEFRVETEDGAVYEAPLDWDPEITKAAWEFTGREGEHEGVIYVEYRLLDGDDPISLKIGDVKLIARLKDGKWVALTPNTDPTLWFAKAHETGDYDYFIVAADGAMYQATLSYVKPVAAAFVSTGAVGVAPWDAGPAGGKIYFEYELQFGGVKVSLAAANVDSITMRKDGGPWQELTPDTDTTLWFNVESAKGFYEFHVETKDGAVYEAPLDWDPEISDAVLLPTGREGPHEGVFCVEYMLVGGGEQVSLKDMDAKLLAIKYGDKWSALTLGEAKNLWFDKAHESGDYEFFIVTADDVMYRSSLHHEMPEPEEAEFVEMGDIGIAPETAGPAAGLIFVKFQLVDKDDNPISLAAANVSSILTREASEEEWRALSPDADPNLWVNVFKQAGTYEYRVVTRAGVIYETSMTWYPQIVDADWDATGRIGIRPDTDDTYVEFALMDGDEHISLKIGDVKLIARLKEGKWVALTPNTDKNLWWKEDSATGEYDFFIATDGGGWYQATLDYVKPEAAEFVSTGDVGIAPDTAGPAAGKIFVEYEMVAGEDVISLAIDDVVSIKTRQAGEDWSDLIPDASATLWLHVFKEAGLYEYRVEAKDGSVYYATLDWDPQLHEGDWVSTGRVGIPPGMEDVFVEYKLMDGDGHISLKVGDVKLIARLKEGKWIALTPNTDKNLWFIQERETGVYEYFVVTSEGDMYQATLDYVKPEVEEAVFVATGEARIQTFEFEGEEETWITTEYEMRAGGVKISLALDHAISIKGRDVGDTEWNVLRPGVWPLLLDSDTSLWLPSEFDSADFEFRVVTKDGTIYQGILEHDPEIKDAWWVPTGREGMHKGVFSIEYMLYSDEGPISLRAADVNLFAVYIDNDGQLVALEPDADDPNFWFDKASEDGYYGFFLMTADGHAYLADLDYERERYGVTFEADGGDPPPDAQQVPYGGKVEEPAGMTKEGHRFDGWYLDEDFETEWKFEDDKVTGPLTLYAKWIDYRAVLAEYAALVDYMECPFSQSDTVPTVTRTLHSVGITSPQVSIEWSDVDTPYGFAGAEKDGDELQLIFPPAGQARKYTSYITATLSDTLNNVTMNVKFEIWTSNPKSPPPGKGNYYTWQIKEVQP